MSDAELERLTQEITASSNDPIDTPPEIALEYLASLNLSDDDLEILLGDVPGLSFAEVKQNASALYFRIRQVVASLVCSDGNLKESIKQAITVGVEAVWLALLSVLGITPETLAAAALKPLAGGLTASGVDRLCVTPRP